VSLTHLNLENLNTKNNLCEKCKKELSPFVTFDVKSQISQILDNEKLLNQVMKNNLNEISTKSVLDLKEGSIYREEKNLSRNRFISLVLNTDGAPITNSRNYNMWPVLGTIVELDPQSRESFKNVVILGNFKHFN
ncbi:unnamed protein product, partial [Brachionus calyciflorus]